MEVVEKGRVRDRMVAGATIGDEHRCPIEDGRNSSPEELTCRPVCVLSIRARRSIQEGSYVKLVVGQRFGASWLVAIGRLDLALLRAIDRGGLERS